MSITPGPTTPAVDNRNDEVVTAANLAIDATGVTEIASIPADEVEAVEVSVTSTAQDFDFNLQMDGADLFADEQSPDNGTESFTPDQNDHISGVDNVTLAIDVSSASGTGGAEAEIGIRIKTRHQ